MPKLKNSIKVEDKLFLYIKSEIIKERSNGKIYKSANDYIMAKLGVL